MNKQSEKSLREAHKLIENDSYDEAVSIINGVLNDHPDCPQALYLLGFIAIHKEQYGVAQALLKRCIDLDAGHSEIWNLYGRAFQEGHDLVESEAAYRKAMTLNPRNAMPYLNLGLQYIVQCKPDKAIELLNKAIALEDTHGARYNMGVAKLMKRDWSGFEGYEASVGRLRDRRERIYSYPFEPRWDGTEGLNVVAYGEQGIGDELTFASCIPDLLSKSRQVIVECDGRLEHLFRRSFPGAIVHGTRFKKEINWNAGQKIDARVAFGSLPKFFRKKDADFTGEPYLKADPDRVLQWKALFKSWGDRPKIGIAWTGGVWATGRKRRSLSLEQLLPILKQDADFISLEYIDPSEEIEAFQETHGIKIHHFNRATISYDYDETAALVAALDQVIGVTTASLHLAGALGINTLALVPECPTWIWGLKGNIPWHKSIKVYRQKKDWQSLIEKIAHENFHRDGSPASRGLHGSAKLDYSPSVPAIIRNNAPRLSAN